METALLRMMPSILVLGSLLPLIVHLLASYALADGAAAAKTLRSLDIFLIASVMTFWTAVLTVTIGCVIVAIMKGPTYVADSYRFSDAPRPRRPG